MLHGPLMQKVVVVLAMIGLLPVGGTRPVSDPAGSTGPHSPVVASIPDRTTVDVQAASEGPRVRRRTERPAPEAPEVALVDAAREYNRILADVERISESLLGAGPRDRNEYEKLLVAARHELTRSSRFLDERLELERSRIAGSSGARVAELDALIEGFRAEDQALRTDLESVEQTPDVQQAASQILDRLRPLSERRRAIEMPEARPEGAPAFTGLPFEPSPNGRGRIRHRPIPPEGPVDPDAELPPTWTFPRMASVRVPAYLGGKSVEGTGPDLDPTPDVQITPEIIAKAAELNNSPVEIYEWVRNNTEVEVYYGSLKGSHAAFDTLAGNDYDLSSLLIAMLRASNVPARYVQGRVWIPNDRIANLLGVRNWVASIWLLFRSGIPYDLVDRDGDGSSDHIEIERVWVEAQIPHSSYRGISGSQGSSIWVPLDPAFKQFDYQEGISALRDNVVFDETTYLATQLPEYAYEFYEEQARDWLIGNMPGTSLDDVPYTGPPSHERFGLLPGSLPYDVVIAIDEWTEIPDEFRHFIRICISPTEEGTCTIDEFTRSVEVSRSRITLSWDGAGATRTPELKFDGAVAATGNTATVGSTIWLYLASYRPWIDLVDPVPEAEDWIPRSVGDYHAFNFDFRHISKRFLDERTAILIEANEKVGLPEEDADDLTGELLYLVGQTYYYNVNAGEQAVADLHQARLYPQYKGGVTTIEGDPVFLYDRPLAVTPSGTDFTIDIRFWYKPTRNVDNDTSKNIEYEMIVGDGNSAAEHGIWEELVHIPSISTVKALQFANEMDLNGDATPGQGDVLELVNPGDEAALCPTFSASRIARFLEKMGDGLTVITPYCEFCFNDWKGLGWMERSPSNGGAGYWISGGIDPSCSSPATLGPGVSSSSRSTPARTVASGQMFATTVRPRGGLSQTDPWVRISRQAFDEIAACGGAGATVLMLTEARDVARLALPAESKRRIRDWIERGNEIEALHAPVDCGGHERYAFFVGGTDGFGFESLLGGGAGTTTTHRCSGRNPGRRVGHRGKTTRAQPSDSR